MSDIRNHYRCARSQLKPLNKRKQSAQKIVHETRGHSSAIFHFPTVSETTWQTFELQNGNDTSATCFRELERHAVLVQVTFL